MKFDISVFSESILKKFQIH